MEDVYDEMMRSIRICNKIFNIIEKIYEKTTCAVVVNELLTEWILTEGCLFSPTLVNFFLGFVMDELK